MIYYVIAQLLNTFTTIVLGLFVYLKNRGNLVNRMFALHCLTIAIWAFSFAQMAVAQNAVEGLFWSRALHVGAIFIPVFLLHFICALLDIVHEKKKILVAAYIIGFSMLAFVPTNLFVSHTVAVVGFKYFVGPAGLQYHLFPLFFFVCTIYAFYELFKGFKHSQGLRKNQIKYLLVAFLIGYIGGPTGFLPLYHIPIPRWGLYTISIFSIIVAYAIVKYRLLDISIAIKTGTAYALLAVLTTGISIGLIVGVDRIFAGYPGYNPILATAIILLIIIPVFTYLLPRVKLKTESTIEKILYKNKYAYLDTLRAFSKRMTFILDQEELLQSVVRNVAELMGLDRASIFVANEGTGKFELRARAGETLHADASLPEDSAIISYLRKNKKSFLKEEMEKILPQKEMAKIEVDLNRIEASLLIPLVGEGELIGIFALGEKASKEMFSHLDIELLETLANQTALILNYKHIEEQLRQQQKLLGLGTMAAGIGHEIGNAIVSIQTFLQLFPERRLDKEFYGQFGKTALEDSQRIAQLVDMMRKLAQTHSSMSEFKPMDIRMVIEQAALLLKKAIDKKNIKIVKRYQEVPEVRGDESLLLMAFLNLFRNSLDFLPSGGEIAISLSDQEKFRLGPQGKPQQCVRIEIADNGPGIAKEHLSRVFEPFFTTRHEGIGLGLSMVHRVIEEHGGKIVLDSQLGKGATFTIHLPLGDRR
jgi:signal transduction histidine kinase